MSLFSVSRTSDKPFHRNKVLENDVEPFSEEELKSIFKQLDRVERKDFRTRRLKALALVLRWTGLRIGDAVRLKRSDIVGEAVRIKTSKTRKDVMVDIPPEVVQELSAIEGEALFLGPSAKRGHATDVEQYRRLLVGVFSDAGVENRHPHRFRHTFAVDLLNAG